MKGVALRGNIYWYRGVVKGVVVQESLGTRDEAVAITKAKEVIRRARMDAINNPPPDDDSAATAIADFVASRKALGLRPLRLVHLRDKFAKAFRVMNCSTPAAVTQAHVKRWMEGYKNFNTRKVNFHDLSRIFRWLIEQKRLESNPCDGLELPLIIPRPVRRRFLTPEQAERVMTTPCAPDLRFALFCMLHAGLRYGEVCAARPDWFDLNAGILHIAGDKTWRTKTGADRSVPLTRRFVEFLATYGQRSPYMLRPEKKTGSYVYRVDLRKAFAAHLKACGVVCTYHDLRRTFASLHVSAGTPIYIVAKWLGDTINVTEMHYAHLHHSGDDIERAWSKKT